MSYPFGKECAFKDNPDMPCPVPADWGHADIIRRCESGRYGHNCAALVAQRIVADTIDFKTFESSIDLELGPIVAYLRMIRTPRGEAPLKIRQSVGKLTYPLRESRPAIKGRVPVSHPDLVLTLMNAEKLKEARWYDEASRTMQVDPAKALWWGFSEKEGQVYELDIPRTSPNEYDQSFSLGSAALGNTYLPPLGIAKAAYTGTGLSTTVPISDLFK